MTAKLWEVPFTFRYTGRLLVFTESAEAALEQAEEELAFDRSNVSESCVFYDAGNSIVVDDKCVDAIGVPTVKAELGQAVESKLDPADFGFTDSPETDEFDPDLENPRSQG